MKRFLLNALMLAVIASGPLLVSLALLWFYVPIIAAQKIGLPDWVGTWLLTPPWVLFWGLFMASARGSSAPSGDWSGEC